MADQNGRSTFVILGASGDLTQRKLGPALFHLLDSGALPDLCSFVGVARSDYSDETFRNFLREGVGAVENSRWAEFASHVSYCRGSSTDATALKILNAQISASCSEGQDDNRVYHLALKPSLYQDTLTALAKSGSLDESSGSRRVVIEKPFGTDYESARQLNNLVHSVLSEDQVFRIDHYLGKDTVQNILVFRFANTIFEPVWNRNYVDHVQISALEDLGVEGRGAYYDGAGVLRDMVQSHLMQLMALVAMEPPVSSTPDALRNEKAKVLSAVRQADSRSAGDHSVRGQYEGYLDEAGVEPGSTTSTFGAIKLFVDTWRWQGVPFILRSGKALCRKTSEISPGAGNQLAMESLNFHFPPGVIRDAYERLLLDAIEGDATHFNRSDEIEFSWKIIDPFVESWTEHNHPPLLKYAVGSSGPPEAEELLGNGRKWILTDDT